MRSVAQRLLNVVKGKSHAVLDKMEKPEEQLVVFIEDLNNSVMKLQKGVTAAIADEKKLKLQLDQTIETTKEWERKAIFALKDNDEDLAREALLRKETAESQATTLHKDWMAQKEAAEKLKISLRQAKSRVDEAKRNYTLLVAKYQSAKTKKKMAETFSSLNEESPLQLMDELNEKILQLEAETDANMEIMGNGIDGDLEEKFTQLENAHRGDKALAELKAKLATSIKDEGNTK